MRKIILLIVLTLITGCVFTPKTVYQKFTVDYFYLDSCGLCTAFKNNSIPLLEKEFGDSITINYYNMDDKSSVEYYLEICRKLYIYDFEYLNDVPFIVVNGYFALLGYSKGEEKELVKDIKRALKNEQLGKKLEDYRWVF